MLVSLNGNNLNMHEVTQPVSESNGWQPSLANKITRHKDPLVRLSKTLSKCLVNSVVVHSVLWAKVNQKVSPEVCCLPLS